MIIDAEIDVCPSYGWQGGPEFNTLIKALRSGRERRRPLWGQARHRYLLPFQNITDSTYLSDLKAAYLAAHGCAHSFRVKDYSDFQSSGQAFAVGDGVRDTFELGIQHVFGNASYMRRVMWPVPGAVFRVGGVAAPATFDYATGLLTFDAAPASGAPISWVGEFRVIVRFASDAFPMSIDNRSAEGYAMNGSVELVEVWE